MRKWSFFLAVAFVVSLIGCGGSSGGTANNNGGTNGTTTTTTTSSGRSGQGVNIPNTPGLIDNYLLPTQGRQALTYYTDIGNIVFTDLNGNSTLSENNQTILPVTFNLNSQSQNPINYPLDVTVPFMGSGLPATDRTFNQMQMFFNDFYTSDNPTLDASLQAGVPCNLTAYQGRITAVQIYLNDGDFNFTQASNNNPPVFNQANFVAQNADPATGVLSGFMSDYFSVDISSVPSKPVMSNGQTAGRFYISGDNFAVARSTPTSAGAYFEVLTPFGVFPGNVYTAANNSQGLPTKSYQLTQPGVLSLTNPGNVTSMEGLWYDYFDRISATDTTLMISFPPTGDGTSQEFVLVDRSGSTFPSVYFGNINYASVGAPTFTAFPIADLEPGSVAGEVTGSLSNLVDGNGVSVSTLTANWWRLVHAGRFAITKGNVSGIATSGRLVVYRV